MKIQDDDFTVKITPGKEEEVAKAFIAIGKCVEAEKKSKIKMRRVKPHG